jgi:hypothetical protein
MAAEAQKKQGIDSSGSDSSSNGGRRGSMPKVPLHDPNLDNAQFKKEIEKRLMDVKEPSVLDFGVEDHSLWDEISGHKENQIKLTHESARKAQDSTSKLGKDSQDNEVAPSSEHKKRFSLWWIIYDCISKYPKFE